LHKYFNQDYCNKVIKLAEFGFWFKYLI
jgi:hypothetical protein